METINELRQRLRENIRERELICKQAGLTFNSLKTKLYNPGKFTFFDILIFRKVMNLTMDETIKIFAPFVAKHNSRGEN